MKVLVIGSGGREHALAWKIAQSPEVDTVFVAPGNPGIETLEKGLMVQIAPTDFSGLQHFIEQEHVDLTLVGPEDPLAAGIVDALSGAGHVVFGPTAAAARLESSKTFAKEFMLKHGIPTAEYAGFDDPDAAKAYLREKGAPIVVKADGLAAGKGVTVAHTIEEAEAAIDQAMVSKAFGEAGARVILEECLQGEEASVLAFCDGKTVVAMPAAQDHKPVFEGDQGPNTGGMGAYSPAPVLTPALEQQVYEEVLQRCVAGMAAEGTPYKGILYAGLMITANGPKVIEFNCRFGDPETQVVLPRMRGDLVPVLIACCNGTLDQVRPEYEDNACVTVVMASGGYPGAYEKNKPILGLDATAGDDNLIVFHAGTRVADIGLVTNGGRVLNVTARAANLREALDRAYAAIEKITFEGAHYRRDIGQKALQRGGAA